MANERALESKSALRSSITNLESAQYDYNTDLQPYDNMELEVSRISAISDGFLNDLSSAGYDIYEIRKLISDAFEMYNELIKDANTDLNENVNADKGGTPAGSISGGGAATTSIAESIFPGGGSESTNNKTVDTESEDDDSKKSDKEKDKDKDKEAKKKAKEEEAKKKAEEDRKKAEEEEAKKKAEEEDRKKAEEEEARKKAEEEDRKKAEEEEAKKLAEEEDRKKAEEEEAKKLAEEEAKKKEEEEAKKLAEEEAKKKAEEEAKRKAEEEAKKQAEEEKSKQPNNGVGNENNNDTPKPGESINQSGTSSSGSDNYHTGGGYSYNDGYQSTNVENVGEEGSDVGLTEQPIEVLDDAPTSIDDVIKDNYTKIPVDDGPIETPTSKGKSTIIPVIAGLSAAAAAGIGAKAYLDRKENNENGEFDDLETEDWSGEDTLNLESDDNIVPVAYIDDDDDDEEESSYQNGATERYDAKTNEELADLN